MRNEDTFLTDKNIQFESMIGFPVLVLLYLVLFFWIIGLLNSTTFVKRRKRLYKVMVIALKISVRVMSIIYLISGLIMISLVATNAFQHVITHFLAPVLVLLLTFDFSYFDFLVYLI